MTASRRRDRDGGHDRDQAHGDDAGAGRARARERELGPSRTATLPLWLAAATCATSVVVAWAGRGAEGRRYLAEGDRALAGGDAPSAIEAFRIAAEARCPGCAAPADAEARLSKLAKDAEARGDDVTAFAAWRAIRSAAVATSGRTATRTNAEVELARLGHRIETAAVAAGASGTEAASEERLRLAYAGEARPTTASFALLAIGGVAFVTGALRFAGGRSGRLLPLLAAGAGAAVVALALLLF